MLTVRQAAQVLEVHPNSIRNWVQKGLLACWITPGGHRRFRREDLDRLLRQSDGNAADQQGRGREELR